MRILRVISSTNPKGGGPIEGIRQLAVPLHDLGHHVEIACCDAPASPWFCDIPSPTHGLGPNTGGYGYTDKLVLWLVENAASFDAVIVNGIWQYHSFAVWRAMRKLKRPYVVFTHGMLDPWFKKTYPLKHLKKCLYWPWGEYRVLRDAAAVLFTCEEERILARQSFRPYKVNERVVNYGTAGPLGDPVAQRQAFQEAFPLTAGRRNILFLSRVHPKKGCDLAIRAFAAVAKEESSLQLIMAGPDQVGWQAELRSLAQNLGIADRVLWTGMLTGDLKWGAYHASEAFFLPSHQENFGIVVAEALACGKPVLISSKINIWREIEQDHAGFIANDDPEGATDLLRRWLSLDEGQRAAMSVRARKCFETRFEIRQAAESLLKVLQEFVP